MSSTLPLKGTLLYDDAGRNQITRDAGSLADFDLFTRRDVAAERTVDHRSVRLDIGL